jgi:hypothetical protein
MMTIGCTRVDSVSRRGNGKLHLRLVLRLQVDDVTDQGEAAPMLRMVAHDGMERLACARSDVARRYRGGGFAQ